MDEQKKKLEDSAEKRKQAMLTANIVSGLLKFCFFVVFRANGAIVFISFFFAFNLFGDPHLFTSHGVLKKTPFRGAKHPF